MHPVGVCLGEQGLTPAHPSAVSLRAPGPGPPLQSAQGHGQPGSWGAHRGAAFLPGADLRDCPRIAVLPLSISALLVLRGGGWTWGCWAWVSSGTAMCTPVHGPAAFIRKKRLKTEVTAMINVQTLAPTGHSGRTGAWIDSRKDKHNINDNNILHLV